VCRLILLPSLTAQKKTTEEKNVLRSGRIALHTASLYRIIPVSIFGIILRRSGWLGYKPSVQRIIIQRHTTKHCAKQPAATTHSVPFGLTSLAILPSLSPRKTKPALVSASSTQRPHRISTSSMHRLSATVSPQKKEKDRSNRPRSRRFLYDPLPLIANPIRFFQIIFCS